MPQFVLAENEPEGADDFQMTIPTVYLHINGGQEEVDKMNASDDHSYHCTGTMDIEVPDGFSYVDSDATLSTVRGLGIDIRGRGNSTWNSVKKPYKIKLDEKSEILGMGENKHWALIANAFDPSMMRNRITYWLGKQLGMEFTPSGYPVDVFMEGEYYGSYLLCETIRVGSNRVDIHELEEDITSGRKLTGGYLLQFLQDFGSVSAFTTRKGANYQNQNPNFDPDDGGYENDAQKNYIRGYVQEAEDAMYEGETPDENDASGYRALNYRDYIDIDSASLYWLFQEFSKNTDAFNTGSSYFYKTRDKDGQPGKIFWGPLWDFDFAWDNNDTYEGDSETFSTDAKWMTALMTDTTEGGLPDAVKENWPAMRTKLLEITEPGGLLDQYKAEISTSAAYDQEKYQRYDADGEPANLDDAVEHLRDWINGRIDYFDANLGTLDEYSYRVYFKQDESDEHPQVFAIRKGSLVETEVEEPQKEGYIFLGWFTEDGSRSDKTRVESELTFYPKYVSEEDAVKAEAVYFGKDEVYVTLKDGEFNPQVLLLPKSAQDTRISWTSSDKSVATVDETGTVKLLRTGVVTITATLSNGISESYTLHVIDEYSAFRSARVSREVIYMKPGDIRKIGVIADPVDSWNAGACNPDSEEDGEIIDVDASGVIIAKKVGRAKVRIDLDYQDATGWDQVVLYCDVIVSDREGTLSTETVTEGIDGRAIDLDRIAEDFLSDEDKADLAGGADVKVWLQMTRLADSGVPAKDKQALANYASANRMTEGCYVDISLLRKVGDNDTEELHKVSKPVEFAVTVPDELRDPDTKGKRTFYLLHANNGRVTVTAKGKGAELNGKSASFSTYMIAWSEATDSPDTADSTVTADDTDNISHSGVKTGDDSALWLWMGMMLPSIIALASMIIRKRRKA